MRLIVMLAVVAYVITGAASAAPGQSGLRGVVTRGPVTPVCVAETPCTEPARNVMLIFSRAGHVIGRAVTDGQGRYRLRLPAGLYAVRRASSPPVDKRLEPDRARVFPRRFARVDFSIDTGIR